MWPLPGIDKAYFTPSRRKRLGLCLIVLAGMFVGWLRFGRVSLEIEPTVFAACKGPNTVVHVRWDAISLTKGTVYLLIHKPGQAPTVWLAVAPKGEADTGKWASDGWTVALADSHHRRLAKRTLETVPCGADSRF